MRKLVLTPFAHDAIIEICHFVEFKNTEGSGERYYNKFISHLEKLLPLTNLKFPLCRNQAFANNNYSCIVFQEKWIVAFLYNKDAITIYHVILGSRLK